jgi:hypothetical protein
VSRIPRIGIKPYAKPAVATPMGIWMGRKKPAVTKTGDVRATTMATQAVGFQSYGLAKLHADVILIRLNLSGL